MNSLKNHLFLIATVLISALLFMGNSSNPPNGKTGAPGDGSCSECHSGNNFEGTIDLLGLPDQVVLGETYRLELLIDNTDGLAERAGFQMVALFDSTNLRAGDFTVFSGDAATNTVLGKEYLEHRGAKTLTENQASWTFDWTAPEQSGLFTIYAVGNITNGSGSSGDAVKFATFTAEAVDQTTNSQEFLEENIRIYPNPVTTAFVAEHTGEIKSLSLRSSTGLIADLRYQNLDTHRILVDIEHVPPGLYYLIIGQDSDQITTTLIKM